MGDVFIKYGNLYAISAILFLMFFLPPFLCCSWQHQRFSFFGWFLLQSASELYSCPVIWIQIFLSIVPTPVFYTWKCHSSRKHVKSSVFYQNKQNKDFFFYGDTWNVILTRKGIQNMSHVHSHPGEQKKKA